MKKLALITAAAMILLAPMSSFALEAMSADSMKSATGQAGVTIGIDDVILYQNTGNTVYKDNDGTDGTAAGVQLTGAESLLFINAVVADATITGTYDTQMNYGAMLAAAKNVGGTNMGLTLTPAALTIDVGTCDLLTAITTSTTDRIAGVVIGLPTLEIYDALAAKNQVISLVQSGATNDTEEFIEIQQTGSVMAILGGTLEIAPH